MAFIYQTLSSAFSLESPLNTYYWLQIGVVSQRPRGMDLLASTVSRDQKGCTQESGKHNETGPSLNKNDKDEVMNDNPFEWSVVRKLVKMLHMDKI